MTAASFERNTDFSGAAPGRGTFPIAAATTLLKGTIAVLDASQNANVPAAGRDAVGKLSSTYLNPGSAGDVDAEVEYGVFSWAITGTTPVAEEVVYVVDNQTVSIDSSGGTRGIAGIVVDIKNGQAQVWMGPHVIALVRPALRVAALRLRMPIGACRLSTGAAIPAFSNGVADGFSLVDAEAFALRINNGSTTQFWGDVALPSNLDANQPVVLHFIVSRVGAADASVGITPHVFRNRPGVLHDAGGDLVSGDTTFATQTTKQVTDISIAITGAAASDSLSVGFQATASLANDDLLILDAYITCFEVAGT